METTGQLIAAGRTAEIYAWGEGRVLKLLRPGFSPGLIQQEEAITRVIGQAGLPAPKIYEVVEVDGRAGIVFERIDGPSLFGVLEQHPLRLRQEAEQLARLHARIHAHSLKNAPAGSPLQKEILARQICQAEVLPEATRQAVLDLLDRLPGGETLCHNDFHPFNVLVSPRGPVIIDWESASLGNPCADVARTCVTLALAQIPEETSFLFKKFAVAFLNTYISAYLASYRAITHNPLANLRDWQTVQAAAKVQGEAPSNQARWLKVIERGLKGRR